MVRELEVVHFLLTDEEEISGVDLPRQLGIQCAVGHEGVPVIENVTVPRGMLVHKVRAILSWNGELLNQATSLFHLVDAKKLRGGSLQLGARTDGTSNHC